MIPSIKEICVNRSFQLAASLVLFCIALQYAGLAERLRFDRAAIESGHWWLLLSGNFVHLGMSHLWMNLAGFVLIVCLVWSRYSVGFWLLIIVVASVTVGLGLWWLNPEVHRYVGFSGTLHGLLLAGVIADLRFYPRSSSVLLIAVIGKLLWEQISGALPGSESVAGGHVIVDAHLYGAIAGLALGLAHTLAERSKHRLTNENNSISASNEKSSP